MFSQKSSVIFFLESESDLKLLSLHGNEVCLVYSKNRFLPVFVSASLYVQCLL